LATTAPRTRHTVTAIIVAHDGARLLPGLVGALDGQTYPVEQTVAVDTGSRDRSGAVLGELIGEDAVFGMPRGTGYGEAVAVALRHAARLRSAGAGPDPRRVEWIWLLHDDCEPAPDALEKLLRAAGKNRSVTILGPKVRDGQDRRTLREAGVSIDRAGRRVTGIDPGEIDQGQHDHQEAVLAVGSAGMLVRRDAWDRLGGFDPRLKLFRDDVDFCWRAQAAGFRVQLVTDAVLYHHELSARRRRDVEGGSARVLDRRNALYVLAVNLPLLPMLWVVGGCVLGSLARAFYFLLTKQLDLAASYAFSVASLFGHPIRLMRARHRRARGRADGYNAVRVFIPPARTLFRVAERVAGLVSNGPPQASGGRHQASGGESEEDEQFSDEQSVMRRVIGHPGVQLFAGLLLVSLIAERRLLGSSPLGGGALVPAWGGAAALWQEYLAGFHAVSVGSSASASPYLAVVAVLATVLGGQAWLAVDVLLLGCVPLSGVAAYLASRSVVTATPARVLLAASYALLPVATGAVAAGRLGTAVAFILLPLIAASAGRMLTAAPRKARRAAWATGLLIAVAAAFAPLTWVLGLVFAVGVLAARRWLVSVEPVNAAIVVVTPFFVLFPWSLHLLASPSAFLSEAGLSTPALVTRGLSPAALFALSPGGPGVPPLWVTAGFGLALIAAFLPGRRAGLVVAGWTVAVAGLLAATVVSRISVTPTAGQPADGWPGVALALAALGLLLASAPVAERLAAFFQNEARPLLPPPSSPDVVAGRLRRLLAAAAFAAAATVPLFVAVYWVNDGVQGPVGNVTAQVLPAFVAASSTTGEQYRTLILRSGGSSAPGGGTDYTVVREGDPTLGEPELGTSAVAQAALSREVAALASPDEADNGDPGLVLGEFGIRYVLLPGPVDAALAQQLDAAVGLLALSKAPTYDLWQVTGPVARARVVAADGTVTALSASSNAVNMSGMPAPASGGTLVLADPYGGWTAKLNGQALKPLANPVDGWAQGFALPSGGGQLSITRNDTARVLSLTLELIMLLAVCLLALPGKRADPVREAEALAALREARNAKRAARSARLAGAASAGHWTLGATAGATVGVAGRTVFARLRPAGRPRLGGGAAEAAPAGSVLAGETALAGQSDREGTGAGPLARDDRRPELAGDDRLPEDDRAAEDDRAGVASAGVLGASVPDPEPWPGATETAFPEMTFPERGFPETSFAETGTAETDFAGPAPYALGVTDEDVRAPDSSEDNGWSAGRPWDTAGDWGSAALDRGGRDGADRDGADRDSADRDSADRGNADRGNADRGNAGRDSADQGTVGWDSADQDSADREDVGRESVGWDGAARESVGWETAGLGGASGAWSAGPAEDAASRDSPAWPTGPYSVAGSTGPQPVSESTGSQPVSGSTGPRDWSWPSAPPTNPQPRYTVESDPPPPPPPTSPQPRYPWQSGPQVRPAWTREQAVAPTGSQPVTGPEPAGTGPQPAGTAPWESADWDAPRDLAPVPEGAGSVAEQSEPESGSGPWPAAARPPAKPEVHSHRGGKHSKPSRWRRPGGDGKS